LGEIGGFGPYIPEEYGGAGLDQISYGLIMQEIERGDSGVRSIICSIIVSYVSYLEIRKRRTTHEIFTKVGYW
jgi:alkylation response protein AidB-like acyl-CoA dehydrogenase